MKLLLIYSVNVLLVVTAFYEFAQFFQCFFIVDPLLNICRQKDIELKNHDKNEAGNPFVFSLKLVDISSFTNGHHQNYCEIRKQHHITKFKTNYQYALV